MSRGDLSFIQCIACQGESRESVKEKEDEEEKESAAVAFAAMAIANENFDVGGTGGAIFAGPAGAAPGTR